MRNVMWMLLAIGVLAVVVTTGCARTARNTEGFAKVDSADVSAAFEDAWQATKAVLRDKKFDIYTRDKRGLFVAYSETKRHLFVPERIQYTIMLDDIAPGTTRVTIETLRQVYGVTLLTYHGWHERKTTDNTVALEILQNIQAKVNAPSTIQEPAEAAEAEAPDSSEK